MNKRGKVVGHLWEVLRPSLDCQDFRTNARAHAYRDHEHTVDVIKIEFFDGPTHRVWGTSTHSFGLSCGVFFKFAPNPFGGPIALAASGMMEPDETSCAIRTYLFRGLSQPKSVPKNVWSVTVDCSNLDAVAVDALRAFEHNAVQWFSQFRSLGSIVALLDRADEDMEGMTPCFGFGRRGSPVRNLYLGFVAAADGQRQKALSALVASMAKGGFAALSGSVDVDDAVRRKIEELSR